VDLELRDESVGSWAIVVVRGELDLHTSATLATHVTSLIDSGSTHIALDLSAVPFMDSSTLGVIVTHLKHLREQRGELALIGTSGSPAKVLAITGMDRIIPLFASSTDLPA
jgi:anti-sigma B factor antagonist